MKKIYLLLAIAISTLTFAASTYLLAPGGTVSINEFGICKTLNNSSAKTFIVPTGISSDWNAFINYAPTGVSISACTNNCIGSWGACTGGVQTYAISQPAFGGGAACPYANGATQSCPVDCVGSWSACSSGTQTYTVTTPASGGGASCPSVNGAIATCGVNCVGSWGACNSGSQVFTVTTPASGGGAACSNNNGDTQTCSGGVDCIGSWGTCSKACGGGVQIFNITQPASGTGVACSNANGDSQTCNTEACYTKTYAECFIPGTKVSLSSGEFKNIEDVEIGDKVLSFDETKNEIISTSVIEVFHHEEKLNELYTFLLKDGTTITSNGVHPYFLPDNQDYFSAQNIYKKWKVGERIYLLGERSEVVEVVNITKKSQMTKLYNIHVMSPYDLNKNNQSQYGHNYFSNGVLVHNRKCATNQTICEAQKGEACCQSLYADLRYINVGGSPAYVCSLKTSDSSALDSCYNSRKAACGGLDDSVCR